MLAALVTLSIGCGNADDDRIRASESAGLPEPTFDLTPGTQAVGVGGVVFVTNGVDAAILHPHERRWEELPRLSGISRPTVAALGSEVLAIGLDCGECKESGARGRVVVGALDVDRPNGWSVRKTPLEGPLEAELFSVADAGVLGEDRVFYVNTDLLAVSPDLAARVLPAPPAEPWSFCGTGSDLQALVPTAEGAARPLVERLAPTVGKGGNATVALLASGPVARESWQVVKGGATAELPATRGHSPGSGQEVLAATTLCGPEGLLLATAEQTFVWNGTAWQTFAGGPPGWQLQSTTVPTALDAAVVASDGAIVSASGTPGRLAVFADGKWSSRTMGELDPGDPDSWSPTLLAVTGDEVVALVLPSKERGGAIVTVVNP
jgi:hypothetical protein